MVDIPKFTGFPEEALSFFAELAVNNNREWFNPRKTEYKNLVLEPAQAFVLDFGQRMQELIKKIQYDPRTSGSGSIKRIYRDTRFSKDKTPYKTHLGIHFWQGQHSTKMDNPGFYFHMGLDGSWLYGGHHMFPKPLLAAYRQALLDEGLGNEVVSIIDRIINVKGFETGGEHYKRVPQGFDKDHPLAQYLRYNGLWAASDWIDRETLTSPRLVEVCLSHAETMLPLIGWLNKVDATAQW